MQLYEQNLLINILEAKILDTFNDYYPQGQYNNIFLTYLYKYIRKNTYSGEHYELLRQLIDLKRYDNDFKNTIIKESTNKKTYTITDDITGITDIMKTKLFKIFSEYYNYNYVVISDNRIIVDVNFGWLPESTASWLNLLNSDCLLDYYIDDITLRKNTYNNSSKRPDSGYVCYKIDNIKEYDTIMFVADKKSMDIDNIEIPKFKVASLLTELKGSKGATLNRIVEFKLNDFFYEVGPYAQNYLSAEKSSVIIQVPYEYAVAEYYYLYDVSNVVHINNENNKQDKNSIDNYFVLFNDPNFENKFTKYKIINKEKLVDKITKTNIFNETFIQYLLSDFIWKNSDSKLIAYAQNLINRVYSNTQLLSNGIWSKDMSVIISKIKTKSEDILFDDDVIDKNTENILLNSYTLMYNLDPNEHLWNEW